QERDRNLLGAHSLPEVEPENHAIALLVRPRQATIEVLIDLSQKDSEGDFLLAPIHLFSGLGLQISGGNVRVATTRRLTMSMLEIVVSGVSSGSRQVAQNRFRTLDRKVPKQAASAFPEFQVGRLNQVLHQRPRRLAPQPCGAHDG